MTDQNKKLVHDFYDLAFNRHEPREAAKLYIGERYIQHNPFVPNGVAPFVEHFEAYFKEHPGSRVVFSHILAENGAVTVGVPHDQGQHNMPVDNGQRYDSTATQ